VREEGVELVERVGEGAQRPRPPGRGEQPRLGLVPAAAVEPVPGHQARGGPGGGEAAGGVAVDVEPSMRRDLLDEGLAHQVVPEPVAGARGDQRARVERDVQQRERPGLGQPGERGHVERVEVVADHGQPAQQRRRRLVEVEHAVGDRGPRRRRPRGPGQLQREERVALGHRHDPRPAVRVDGPDQRRDLGRASGPSSIVVQRPARSSPATALASARGADSDR
jgi:hypothetical protein